MKNILVIGSHFDDLELCCGGTLASFCHNGDTIFAIIVSHSSGINCKGEIIRKYDEAFIEGYAGLTTLGLDRKHIICLGYENKKIKYEVELIENIEKYILTLLPDLIITHTLHDTHQDHCNTAKSVISASRYQNNIWMFEPQYPSALSNIEFHPTLYIDITDTMEIKKEAILKHTSQIKSHPCWIDLITSQNKLRGIEIHKQYAEAFEPLRMEYKI